MQEERNSSPSSSAAPHAVSAERRYELQLIVGTTGLAMIPPTAQTQISHNLTLENGIPFSQTTAMMLRAGLLGLVADAGRQVWGRCGRM
jgi:hypothetical protein